MLKKVKIIAIGELLWDCFPDGMRLGGAPANVAFHCAQYGADAGLISAIGNDEPGREAIRLLETKGIDTTGIQRSDFFPTGLVNVTLSTMGKPTYRIEENTAWDNIKDNSAIHAAVLAADGICFGTLAQRNSVSRETIRHFLKSGPASCLKVFDVNLRQDCYDADTIRESLKLANVLKLNDEELPVLAKIFDLKGSVSQQLQQLIQRFDLKALALTRGPEGAIIMTDGLVSDCPCVPIDKVIDSVGAGDAFTAVLMMGLILGYDINVINKQAVRTASYVCCQAGATPELPDGLTHDWA